ncbi:hypothetical protein C4J81_01435 [Deltaproteobacteria bacterium Smac51]|nr:hypothetical protein C4J81_01435 [Deltaproteobacteria bacterium Smac51]
MSKLPAPIRWHTFQLSKRPIRQPPGKMFLPGEVTKDPRNLAGQKHFSRRRSPAFSFFFPAFLLN